jgi:hypothetical protein
MVNWDDWIQCEEDSEMLIYEEWQRWVLEGDCTTQRSKIDAGDIASENSP